MALFPALEQRKVESGTDRSAISDFWYQLLSYIDTSSGVKIDEHKALDVTAVYSCINLISRHIGSMPLHVYQHLGGDRSRLATEHPLYSILHTRPNPEMTSMSLRSTLQSHLLGWGTFYANIEWTNNYRKVKSIWPLLPDRVSMERDKETGEIRYIYQLPNGEHRWLRDIEVLRVNGLGYNGLTGYSPILKGREAIGLAIATEKHGALFFQNGAVPGLALTHPGKLSELAHENLRKSWEKEHAGLDNKHRLAILEEGITIKEIGINPQLSQFLETRRFQIEEIARLYNLPLHKISDLSRSTFNNIEHLSQEYLTDCLLPYAVQDEQSYDYSLFREDERGRFYTKHNFEGLLRGDSQARAEFYRTMFNIGAFSPNLILAKENMNPIGPEGDLHMVQVNMMPLSAFLKVGSAAGAADAEGADSATSDDDDVAPPDTLEPIDADADDARGKRTIANAREARAESIKTNRLRLRARHRGLFREAAAQVVTREINTVKRYADKYIAGGDYDGFDVHVDDFYTNVFPEYARLKFTPAVLAYADALGWAARSEVGAEQKEGDDTAMQQFVTDYASTYVARHAQSSRGQIADVVDTARKAEGLEAGKVAEDDSVATAVSDRLNEWGQTRADKVADDEVVRLDGAVCRAVFVDNGFNLTWVSVGNTCPYCEMLDGMTVGRNGYFLTQDQELQPVGKPPMHVRFSKHHPPAHQGCDCMIMATV